MIQGSELAALFQVIVIDISMAADNTIAVGAAAAGLHAGQRHRAVWVGLGAAVALRILLAIFAVRLLQITGLLLAGGLLLLWVAWKMYRDIRRQTAAASLVTAAPKTLSGAILQIFIADIAMSLDNVLAVAGAARAHYLVLALGLIFSVALMGVAATLSAKSIQRWPWLGWIGVAVVLYVAVRMMADGYAQINF